MYQLSRSMRYRENHETGRKIPVFVNSLHRVRFHGGTSIGIFSICTRLQEVSVSKKKLGIVLHMLHVMIEAVSLAVFGIVFDRNVKLLETRFEKMSRLIGVLSATSSCCIFQTRCIDLPSRRLSCEMVLSIAWRCFLIFVFQLSHTFLGFQVVKLFEKEIRF